MSYILDALRKADAQRERDPARGIHAQPVTLSLPAENSAPVRRVWLVGMTLVAGAALLAAATWGLGWLNWFSRPVAPAVTAVLAPTVAPIAATVPPVTPTPPTQTPATEVLPAAPPAPPPSAAPPWATRAQAAQQAVAGRLEIPRWPVKAAAAASLPAQPQR